MCQTLLFTSKAFGFEEMLHKNHFNKMVYIYTSLF